MRLPKNQLWLCAEPQVAHVPPPQDAQPPLPLNALTLPPSPWLKAMTSETWRVT